jgi:hypothetical protein
MSLESVSTITSSLKHNGLSFNEALSQTLEHLIPHYICPQWLKSLSERIHLPLVSQYLKDTENCFESLKLHMLDTISGARSSLLLAKEKSEAGEGSEDDNKTESALLKNLVAANMNEVEGKHLTDDELLSNTFVRIPLQLFAFCGL